MKENGMIRAPHPPYSLDLAPSDFHLFAYVKHGVRGQSFKGADRLSSSIEAVLRGLEKLI
jgi:hypothetical protein